jgi:succinoglycan biosynthesis transport protein ExoP
MGESLAPESQSPTTGELGTLFPLETGSRLPPHRPAIINESEPVRDLVRLLSRHIFLILACIVGFGGAALYKALTDSPTYQTSASVRLTDVRQAMTAGLGPEAPGSQLGYSVDPVLSQIELVKSRRVAEQAAGSNLLRLQALTRDFPISSFDSVIISPEPVFDTLTFSFKRTEFSIADGRQLVRGPYQVPLHIGGASFIAHPPGTTPFVGKLRLLSLEDATNRLMGGLKARARPSTDLIDIQFTAGDPIIARNSANAIAHGFQQSNADAAQQQSRRRRIFVGEQLRATDSVVGVAQAQLSEFRSRARVYSSKDKLEAQQTGLNGIEMRREELAANQKMFAGLLNAIQQHPSRTGLQALVASPGLADNPVILQLYGQLAGYQARRDSLVSAGRAPTDPALVRVDTLLTTAEAQLTSGVESYVTALDAQIGALDELRARNSAAMEALPASESEEARLIQQVQSAQTVADQLREEYQRARIAEAVEAGPVEIVDLAPQAITIGVPRRRIVFFGLLLGLVLGVGASAVLERMNTSIRRLEDLDGLALANLAVIPRIIGDKDQILQRLRLKFGALDGKANRQRAVAVLNTQSRWSEAYRTLRTNLLFSEKAGSFKKLVITSAVQDEGKTTTALNLSATFAQMGMRVLLVDCDLRKASLHKVFDLPRKPGLTDVVYGDASLGEVIRSTPIEGLYLIPSGSLPPNPSELVGGPQMLRLINEQLSDFDLVIIDSPPLLAASDASILAKRVDGVVMVIRAGGTEFAAVRQALIQLSGVGARVLGAVLNDPDEKIPKYGRYYYYDYYGSEK